MATLYVSKAGNDSNDGSTPVLAKLTIGAALTAASNNWTVIIGEGTYNEKISTSLTGVTIQGATGYPEDVVIQSAIEGRTVTINTDCVLKNFTVLHQPPGEADSANDWDNATFAVGAASGKIVYHIDNCYVLSSRGAIQNLAVGSTINRARIEYIGSGSAPTPTAEWPTCPPGTAATTAVVGTYGPGSGNESDAVWTSCLFMNMPAHDTYRSGGFVNCTIASHNNSDPNKRGLYANGGVVNTVVFYDTASAATLVAAGCTTSYTAHRAGMAIYNEDVANHCIVHGWSDGQQGDWATNYGPVGTRISCFDTSNTTAAGGPSALYIDHAPPNYNFRIRSGSLAYRNGTSSYHSGQTMTNYQAAAFPTHDLDGKPFHPTTPSRGCYEYCFGHTASGVSVRRTSGSLGVGSTYIKSMLGVAT